MAKTTALTENTDPIGTDLIYMVDDPGGSAASRKATMTTLQGLIANGLTPGGRLTLTSATPVTTADVTAAATLYYTPYVHPYISMYDGTTWRLVTYTEKSLALGALTASKPYDIFGIISGGTLALEGLVWTNASTRATALAYQDGRLVKSGAATRLYLGSIYINSSGGQTDDAAAGKRNVYNYYNKVWRTMHKEEGTGHTYNSTAGRYWNNDATLNLEFMQGVQEGTIIGDINALTTGSASNPRAFLGLDNNTFNNDYPFSSNNSATLTLYSSSSVPMPAPAAGYHFMTVSEGLTSGSTNSTFTTVFANLAVLA